jgi:hypothetical protein
MAYGERLNLCMGNARKNAGRVSTCAERRDLHSLFTLEAPRFLRSGSQLLPMWKWRASPSCMGVSGEWHGCVVRLGISNAAVLPCCRRCIARYNMELRVLECCWKTGFEKIKKFFSELLFPSPLYHSACTKVYVWSARVRLENGVLQK